MRNDCLAELSGVHKRFGSTVALDGLDLDVRRGELLAVLGPNGAGKTTAISLLLGLQEPDKGSATVFGRPPNSIESRREVGVMMQEVTLAPELRVREHVDLVASYYPAPMTPDDAMEATRTTALAERPYGKLSSGQKRQAQFAMAICGRPKILFLDEPTVGLDIQARGTMWTMLRQLVDDGVAIVLTHYLEEAEALADRVAVVTNGGLIASGTVNEIRASVVRTHIQCSTKIAALDVAAWPGVTSVDVRHNRLHVTANNAESAVRRLLAADEDLEGLEVRRAGLAEVFTELVKDDHD